MGTLLAFSMQLEHAADCITCGVPIIMPENRARQLRRTHESWYCVNGHSQHWPEKTDVEILREQVAEKERQLAFERERASRNFAERQKAEKKLKTIVRRTSGGVCPCCNRTFLALGRHMTTKHPDFVKDAKS